MIHRALYLLRKYHHMTQASLGEKLGISGVYLCEIEKGHKDPQYELLQKYAQLFKMPLSSIMLFAEAVDIGIKVNPGEKLIPMRRLKVACADKILRLLEWIADRDNVDGVYEK